MMKHAAVAGLAVISLVVAPTLATAQSISIARSILPDTPYTLIFPQPMVAADSSLDPVSVTINHPDAPLQCELTIVPVEDAAWTAQGALDALNETDVVSAWSDLMPGFALTSQGTTPYQDATALTYEGASPESAMGMPLSLVHSEAVSNGRGYVLDCYFATAEAERARPIVDFIITNFATRADADCCVGIEVEPSEQPEVTQ